MKVLVFAGSTRTGSWNRKLAHVVAGMVKASGADVTHIELADFDVPMYNADLEARGTPADVMRLDTGRIKVGAAADLVLFRARRFSELLSRHQADRVVLRAPTKTEHLEILDVDYAPIPMDPFREPPGAEAGQKK